MVIASGPLYHLSTQEEQHLAAMTGGDMDRLGMGEPTYGGTAPVLGVSLSCECHLVSDGIVALTAECLIIEAGVLGPIQASVRQGLTPV